MANVTILDGHAAPARASSLIARLRGALAEYRRFRAVHEELSALSDRDLADIGISRHNVDTIARQAVRRG